MASLQVPFSRWDWPEQNAEQTTGVSVSSLPSLLLLDGQAVLAHQTPHAIWLFIGLSSGAIWKWTIGKVQRRETGGGQRDFTLHADSGRLRRED